MSNTQFDRHGEIQLVPGDIHGQRAFKVHRNGTLVSPSYEWPWHDGENTAQCTVHLWCDDFWDATEGGHHIAHPKCSCGFYAYFYEVENDYHNPGFWGTVQAIVRSTGKATVGDRGFRAEKAEIVALVEPQEHEFVDGDKTKDMTPFLKYLLWVKYHEDGVFAATAGSLLATLVAAILLSIFVSVGWAWLATAMVPEFALGIGSLVRSDSQDWSPYQEERRLFGTTFSMLTKDAWQQVLKNYPNVKVYKTMAEAEAAHPMTFHPSNHPDLAQPEEVNW